MEKTKVLLNDVTFLRTIGKAKLKVSIFLGYAWKNGVVEITRGDALYRADFFLALEEKAVQGYVLSQTEMVWLRKVKKLYDRNPVIKFDAQELFPINGPSALK
jgi:hypothetical protein